MPSDHPVVGEVWRLPNQPSLTTSGAGGEAVVVDVRDGSAILYSRMGRRIQMSVRSLLLTWTYDRTLGQPGTCAILPCANAAWFVDGGSPGFPVCWTHLFRPETGREVAPARFFGETDGEVAQTDRCPACDAPAGFPGSGVTTIEEHEVHSCGQCRRDWIGIFSAGRTPEACVLLAERIEDAALRIEERGLLARCRLGSEALDMIREAVGDLGNPPSLMGIPLAVTDTQRGPMAAYMIGYQPERSTSPRVSTRISVGTLLEAQERTGTRELSSGIQRLGGQPDQTDTFTAANLEDARLRRVPSTEDGHFSNHNPIVRRSSVMGSTWWSKEAYVQPHIIEVTDEGKVVKYRLEGVVNVLPIEEFHQRFQENPPDAPTKVGDEWRDSKGIQVKVKELEATAAVVEDEQGREYLLPFAQFRRWKKIDRRTLFERLVDDTEDPV